MVASRRALALLLVAPALALGACGGDGGGGGAGSDADRIRAVIQSVARDAATICEQATDRFLRQVGGDRAGCEKFAERNPDDSHKEIGGDIDVAVDGDVATARFTDNKGRDQRVTFARQAGEWKVDAVGTD
jgi:hypothetical protein